MPVIIDYYFEKLGPEWETHNYEYRVEMQKSSCLVEIYKRDDEKITCAEALNG